VIELPIIDYKPTPWKADAACKGCDPNWWHPPRGGNRDSLKAIAICNTCPVTAECLQYALDNDERGGIWGGVSVDVHRRRMTGSRPARRVVRRPRPPVIPKPIVHGTLAGYMAERRQGLERCPECLEARRIYNNEQRAAGVLW
jgi:hypothetical protein